MTLFQSKNANKKINIDETLFPEIASGNKEAFTKLYHLTDKVIYGYIFSILKNPDDAKDIMQETYLKILSAAHLYQPQGKPLAWMFTIAKNLSLMHIRQKQNHGELQLEELENRHEFSYLDHTEDRLILKAALTILNEREHQIILLHAMAGWKHREIAEYMNLSLANTIKTYNRAIKKMNQYVTEQETIKCQKK